MMDPAAPEKPKRPRIICYHQTIYHNNDFVSVLPLLTEDTGVTHLIVAAIHLNSPPGAINLNDDPYDHPKFGELWAECRDLQANGVRVLGMLGGAARGSYMRLDGGAAQFEAYYRPLAAMIGWAGLDGLDLDVEEAMSLGGIVRLVDRLKWDFGRDFLVTLAPVAPAMRNLQSLSGFDHDALEKGLGRHIAWYNTQFYCGWGDMARGDDYEEILRRGWSPDKIVVGLVTNPGNGEGWVPDEALRRTLKALIQKYPGFGGVMGWEYFNSITSESPATGQPWVWAKLIKSIYDEVLGEAPASA